MIKKILFKSSTFRTIYSFIRFLLFCVILKRYKFLYDDNSVNIENLDLKSLGYNNEVKEAPGDYFKKIRDYEKKSLIKNGLKIENIFNMFSGNRSMLIINPILSLSYLNREKLKVLSVGPRTESEIFCLIGNGFRKENICSIDLQSYSSLIDTGDIHAINFNDNTFDVIICGWTIAYSFNKVLAASELIRVAKDDSIISISGTYAKEEKGSITLEILNNLFKDCIKNIIFNLDHKYFPKNVSSKHSVLTFVVKKD